MHMPQDLMWRMKNFVFFKKTKALFSSKIFWEMGTVTLSFVCDKFCLIIDLIGLKDSSHKLQTNYIINYFLFIFNISYMCHKIWCDWKYQKFCKIFEELNKA
jgi:hypothetical protein